MTNTKGDLKVWYIPQVPMKAYEVEIVRPHPVIGDELYLKYAASILKAIIGLSIFEFDNKVKPDYSDAAGIDRFDGEEWDYVDNEEYTS